MRSLEQYALNADDLPARHRAHQVLCEIAIHEQRWDAALAHIDEARRIDDGANPAIGLLELYLSSRHAAHGRDLAAALRSAVAESGTATALLAACLGIRAGVESEWSIDVVRTAIAAHGSTDLSAYRAFMGPAVPEHQWATTQPTTQPEIRGAPATSEPPRLSFVVPVFNGATTLRRAVLSALAQTDPHVEVVVVDDASTDDTWAVATALAEDDPRVTAVRNEVNRGAYHCRNAGTDRARGELLRILDADDFVSPEMAERAIAHFSSHPDSIVAYVGAIIRFDEDGWVTGSTSQLGIPRLTRRQPGCAVYRTEAARTVRWNHRARISADTELTDWVRAVHGPDLEIDEVDGELPLYFAMTRSDSLTRAATTNLLRTGKHPHGVRALFRQGWIATHRSVIASAAPGLEPSSRLRELSHARIESTPIPESISGGGRAEATAADRSVASLEVDVDIVYAAPLSLPGGTRSGLLREVHLATQLGYRVGLLNLGSPRQAPTAMIHADYFHLIQRNSAVSMLHLDQRVSTALVVIRHPTAVDHLPDEFCHLDARRCVLVVNQFPFTDPVTKRQYAYHYHRALANTRRLTPGAEHLVIPQSHRIGELLATHYPEAVAIVEHRVEPWRRPAPDWTRVADLPPDLGSRTPVIGRHSRDDPQKWPRTADEVNLVYPSDGSLSVAVMGGVHRARTARRFATDGWSVTPFSTDPDALLVFLRSLDVYVYFTDTRHLDAHPAGPLEAIAAGRPVIMDREFSSTYGDAALYAAPGDVAALVTELCASPERYRAQVERGFAEIDRYFSADHWRQRFHDLAGPPR